jgi:hypothetical protein
MIARCCKADRKAADGFILSTENAQSLVVSGLGLLVRWLELFGNVGINQCIDAAF